MCKKKMAILKKKLQENSIENVNTIIKKGIVPTAVLGGLSYLIYKDYKDKKKQAEYEKALGKESETYQLPFNY